MRLDKLLFNRLAEIRPWRWTPKLGEFYYHYDFERGKLCCTMCDPGPDTFQIRVATGNCFRTEKEITPKVLKKILKNLIKHYKLQIKSKMVYTVKIMPVILIITGLV